MKEYLLNATWNKLPNEHRAIVKRQWDSIEAGYVVGIVIFFPLALIEYGLGFGQPLSKGFGAIFSAETFIYLSIAGMYAGSVGAWWGPGWRATKTIHDAVFWGIPFLWAILLLAYIGSGLANCDWRAGFPMLWESMVIMLIVMVVLMILTQIAYSQVKKTVANEYNIANIKNNTGEKAFLSVFLFLSASVMAALSDKFT